MAHLKAYDSFQTKRSQEKKQRAKDRALGKKTDEVEKFVINEASDYGTVIEVRYDDAYVLYDNEVVLAKLRKDINMVCNQVLFPGDKVVLAEANNNYTITNMIKRTSLLSRTKKDSTRRDDIGLSKNIASNVDLAVIVVAAKEPPFHPKFIDRYLMILQNSDIPAVICLNKCDLKTDEEEEKLAVYRDLNIPVVETSASKKIGIEDLKKYLNGKQAIFVGNSGVGKSSLTNAIMDDDEIKTSHVSDKSKRGRHTTTTSKYYVWNSSSSIIDTPGIRSLDVSSFAANEIQDYFPELDNWRDKCKYADCLHYHEPYEACIVKQGVASGLINRSRYESYLRIIGDVLGENAKDDIINEIIPKSSEKLLIKEKEH